MIALLDHIPPALAEEGAWDAAWALGTPDGERYAVAAVRRSHPLPVLAVKFREAGVGRPSLARQFEREDLPALKRAVRAMCPGAAQVISLARPGDSAFVKVTSMFGWAGHGQHAFLSLED